MESEYTTQLQRILEQMTIGIAILDCTTMHVIYANSYLISFCPEPWRSNGLIGKTVQEIIPPDIYPLAAPHFLHVCENGSKISLPEVPYEGFLETRGRTYWHISLELIEAMSGTTEEDVLLIVIEDVTDSVRSRLQLEAIRHISAAIAGQSPLYNVLNRILQAIHDLVGSQRCAILLIDEERNVSEKPLLSSIDYPSLEPSTRKRSTITIVAQQGLYSGAEDWHPHVDERLLLGRVLHTRQALVINDTSLHPEIEFPVLNDNGHPKRPAAVACVPILETLPAGIAGDLLGTIEIYHRHARSLPEEEIKLLEEFAHQAGLAIQNARLFQRTQLLARVASQQAHQLENVMRAIPDGVILYDSEWCLMAINQTARLLLGWSDNEIGMHINEALLHSKAIFQQNSPHSDMIDALEQSIETQDVDEFEMIGANQQSYTMRRSKALIHDETGQTFAYVIVYHDVTEQAATRRQIEAQVKSRTAELAQRNTKLQEAQNSLKLYNDRLKLMLERLPAGVMVISLKGQQITLMNSQARQLLQRMGINLTEPIPQQKLLSDEQADSIHLEIETLLSTVTMYDNSGTVVPYDQQPLYQALYHNEANEAELQTYQTDGQILNLLVNASPLIASNGIAINIVLVWQDITWIKSLERAREDFFTLMAHELKTPMANIRAQISALQAPDMSWSAEEKLAFLLSADEQVERVVGMINHFLDASRVEAGALKPDLEPILLPEMFEDLQERLEALIASSKRRLEIILPENIPAVMADYELIISVLSNLLSNAFRYAPIGDTVCLEAEVIMGTEGGKATAEPAGVTLRVIDHGPGITAERQAELFTRFSTFAASRRPAADRPGQMASETVGKRRNSSGRWSPASGLGLYISKGIIEAHGSVLHVQSNPGDGAIFAFTLALARPARHEVG